MSWFGPPADPRLGDIALAVLLELIEQTAKPAAENAAGRAAREQSAEPAGKQSTQRAAARGTSARSGTSTQQAAENVAQPAAAILRVGVHRIAARKPLRITARQGLLLAAAKVLDAFVGKQRQDRHGDR